MDYIIGFLESFSGLQINDLIAFLALGVMCLLVGGLLIWGVIATGNSVRGAINRDTELQREKKRKEIELLQAQIDSLKGENNGFSVD